MTCPFFAKPDPDYCHYLGYGKCSMMGRRCAMVQRDGATWTQVKNDIITTLLRPFLKEWYERITGKKKEDT